MQQTMAMAMAMAATMAMTTACAPEGACADDMDCAFGQMCGVEGQCVIAPTNVAPGAFAGGVAGDPLMGRDTGSWSPLGEPVGAFSTTGVFDGTIGGASVQEAAVDAVVYTGGVSTTLLAAGLSSTFLMVDLPVEVLTRPGTSTYAADWTSSIWAQACNYDTSSYDESFVEVVVDVSPPRAPGPGDQIVAEDTPVAVVDVIVAVDGEGSTVSGAFTMPAL
jgi:hypothetical protein